MKISVAILEEKVRALEEIIVIIRAPKTALVDDYDYKRQLKNDSTISDLIESRIKPLVGEFEISVINGSYGTPHPRTTLKYLRNSYSK